MVDTLHRDMQLSQSLIINASSYRVGEALVGHDTCEIFSCPERCLSDISKAAKDSKGTNMDQFTWHGMEPSSFWSQRGGSWQWFLPRLAYTTTSDSLAIFTSHHP
jgi:hypothetical protein